MIELKFEPFFEATCLQGCFDSYVEIKNDPDYQKSGFRLVKKYDDL